MTAWNGYKTASYNVAMVTPAPMLTDLVTAKRMNLRVKAVGKKGEQVHIISAYLHQLAGSGTEPRNAMQALALKPKESSQTCVTKIYVEKTRLGEDPPPARLRWPLRCTSTHWQRTPLLMHGQTSHMGIPNLRL